MYIFGLTVAFSLALIALGEVDALLAGGMASRDAALARAMRYAWPAAEASVRSQLARAVQADPTATAFTFTGGNVPACPIASAPPASACRFVARFEAVEAGTTATADDGAQSASAGELSDNVNAGAHEQRVAVQLSVRIGLPAADGTPLRGPLSARIVEQLTFRTFAFAPYASLIAAGTGTSALTGAGDSVGCDAASTCGDPTVLHAYEICTPQSGLTGSALQAALAWCRNSAGGTYAGTTQTGAIVLRFDDDRNVRWTNANVAGNGWTP